MRPKIVIGILLLAAGFLAVIVIASKSIRPQPTAESAVVSISPTNPVAPVASPVISTTHVPGTNNAAAHAEYVRKRIKELNALAMNNDNQSRDEILAEVKNNPDRQIRAAALEAAIQFDDRSVVPPLKAIADQTADPDEKEAILKAIDYINLPSLTEFRAAHPSQPKKAPAQTQTQQSPPANQ
jgi:hypothetical protein